MIGLRKTFRGGFTLIELLVVITIIAVLSAIGLSVMSAAQAQLHATICQANQRQLMGGFLAFATDHDGVLPGGFCEIINQDPIPWHYDWLGSNGDPTTAPQNGTLFPYMGKNYSVYLCPGTSDRINEANRGVDPGDYVSNGRFDYTRFGDFDGCPIRDIKLQSRFWKSDGTYDYLPTPVICEESSHHINSMDAEGDHGSSDAFTHHHFQGSYYGCIDGSVAFYVEPAVGGTGAPGAFNWQSIAPSGKWACIGVWNPSPNAGNNYTGWGYWTHQ